MLIAMLFLLAFIAGFHFGKLAILKDATEDYKRHAQSTKKAQEKLDNKFKKH